MTRQVTNERPVEIDTFARLMRAHSVLRRERHRGGRRKAAPGAGRCAPASGGRTYRSRRSFVSYLTGQLLSSTIVAYSRIHHEPRESNEHYREITQIPTGTWNLDPVHSSIGFAVATTASARSATPSTTSTRRSSTAASKASSRSRASTSTMKPHWPPADARLLRRRAVPRAPLRREVDPSGTEIASRSTAT